MITARFTKIGSFFGTVEGAPKPFLNPAYYNSREFKVKYNLTITGFAQDVANYHHWSFPDKTQKDANNLIITFNELKKAQINLVVEKELLKRKKTDQKEVDKKEQIVQYLEKKQLKLFLCIKDAIKNWYFTIYKGAKNEFQPEDILDCTIFDPIDRQANKFYFVAMHGFDYLLSE